MRKLCIAEIEIGGSGVRTLIPQNFELHLKDETVIVNGKSGSGKTTLLELIRIVTQGTDARRDNNLIREDSNDEETEIRVKIAEAKDPSDVSFFIKTRIKKSGEVINTFQVEENGKIKTTDNPIPGAGKLTVSKLQNLMSTTLTWGADKFLSENHTVVRDFILDTFSGELERKGLLFKKGDSGYDQSINGRIDAAIANRDEIQREQSKLGAYGVNLDGLVQPMYIDMEQFKKQRDVILQDLADLKAQEKNKEQIKSAKVQAARADVDKVLAQAQQIKQQCEQWNSKQLETEKLDESNFVKKHEEANRLQAEWKKMVSFFSFAPNVVKEIESSINNFLSEMIEAENNRPYYPLINLDKDAVQSDSLSDKAKTLADKLSAIKIEYAKVKNTLDELENAEEDDNAFKEKTEAIEQRLSQVEMQEAEAQEINLLHRKFEVLEKYKEADKGVKDLYAERNRLYSQVNCGVKGLSIMTLDEDGKRLGFFYNGETDPDYFGNKNKENRPLTSYSRSQKVFIAAQLQCYLMSLKQYPLNVLLIDDTGIDKKIHQLWNSFANKYGLLILVTSTNDKTRSDLQENEILIENGEIFMLN